MIKAVHLSLLALALLSACSPQTQSESKWTTRPNYYTDSGAVILQVKSDSMRWQNGVPVEFSTGIRAQFSSQTNDTTTVIKANKVIQRFEQNEWMFTGEVQCFFKEPQVMLKTDTLLYNSESGELKADGHLRISSPDMLMNGQGLTTDVNWETYRVTTVINQFDIDQAL